VTNLPALCAVDAAQSAQGAVRYELHRETIAGNQRVGAVRKLTTPYLGFFQGNPSPVVKLGLFS